MSTALARRLATGKIHYGWVVLAATFLTMLFLAKLILHSNHARFVVNFDYNFRATC